MSHETCFWDNSDDTTAFSRSIIHHFANDTNLIFSSKKLGNIEFVINELKHLVQWLKDKMLSLNKTTTELIKLDHLGGNYSVNLILDLKVVNSNYIFMLNIQKFSLTKFSLEVNKLTFYAQN